MISIPNLIGKSNTSRATSEIRDVLLSGGDPLLFSDDKLDHLLSRFEPSRTLSSCGLARGFLFFCRSGLPRRLCAMLKKHHPLFISIHSNHPRELTTEVREALGRLADAGIPSG